MNKYYTFVTNSKWRLLGLLCWLLAAVAAAASPTPAGPGTPALAEALNPDGTLRAGVQGSFDARHFRLRLLPDGRPAFRPAGAGDQYWPDNFRLNGTSGQVNKILQVGSVTYFAGSFGVAGSVRANCIVKWDGTTWTQLGTTLANGTNTSINDLVAIGSDLYVGGTFTTAGGVAANHVAKWNGTTWSALGTGLNDAVRCLAVGPSGQLNVGGVFNTAGDASRGGSFFSTYDTAGALATAAPQAADALLSLYPNPAHDGFRIQVAGVTGATTMQVELLDALGRVVYQLPAPLPATGTVLTVPTTSLAPGTYVLRVQAGDTTVGWRRVLVH